MSDSTERFSKIDDGMSLDQKTWMIHIRFLLNEVHTSPKRQDKILKTFDIIKCFLLYPQHWKDIPKLVKTMKEKLAMLYSYEHVMDRRLFFFFSNFVNSTVQDTQSQCLAPKKKQLKSSDCQNDFTVNFCSRPVKISGDRCWYHNRIVEVIDKNVKSGLDVTEMITNYAHI